MQMASRNSSNCLSHFNRLLLTIYTLSATLVDLQLMCLIHHTLRSTLTKGEFQQQVQNELICQVQERLTISISSSPSISAAFQQATSVVTDGIAEATEFGSRTGDVQGGSFGTYGVEFEGGVGGTATWVSNGQKSWALTDQALVADPVSQIGPRVMAAEPMVSWILESSLRASFSYLG